jgi:hypothetical protein
MGINKGISKELQDYVINWSYDFFSDHIDLLSFTYHIQATTDWDLSALLYLDDKILGVYLIGTNQLSNYKDLRGIEGVLLAVDDSIRGQGWGNKLKDYPKTLGVDYIWGMQLKSLGNLNDWLKRRELVGETEDCYITLEFYKK